MADTALATVCSRLFVPFHRCHVAAVMLIIDYVYFDIPPTALGRAMITSFLFKNLPIFRTTRP